MRISDWSSDVCSSDLELAEKRLVGHPERGQFLERGSGHHRFVAPALHVQHPITGNDAVGAAFDDLAHRAALHRLAQRSEAHTSELQSLMRNSYAVFCLKKINNAHIDCRTLNEKNHKRPP